MDYSLRLCSSVFASVRLVVIYRPPYSSSHPRTVGMFVTEFAEFLESVVMTAEPLVLAGDFNIHVNIMTDNDAAQFFFSLEVVFRSTVWKLFYSQRNSFGRFN